MTRRRCAYAWYGTCPTVPSRYVTPTQEHACARPPSHPDTCMCWCSARPAADGQEALW